MHYQPWGITYFFHQHRDTETIIVGLATILLDQETGNGVKILQECDQEGLSIYEMLIQEFVRIPHNTSELCWWFRVVPVGISRCAWC